MSTPIVVLQGTIKNDGTLEVHEKVNLPPGKVQVTVVPLADGPIEGGLFQRLDTVWATQRARGHDAHSAERAEAELRALRDESEEELRQAIALQEECRKAREASGNSREPGQ